jgi:molybdopterin-guanine dinucleotide biosynthesis adapter protein
MLQKPLKERPSVLTAITRPAVLGFAAFSGTGKTTLLSQLIPLLKSRGLRIAVIKYSHHDVEVDQPGKDSYRLRKAGATPTLLVSPYRQIIISEYAAPQEIRLQEQLGLFENGETDLVLVEGFRDQAFAKIELHRPGLGKPLLYPADQQIIAIASDQPLSPPPPLPCLDLNDIAAIAEFVLHWFSHCRGLSGQAAVSEES